MLTLEYIDKKLELIKKDLELFTLMRSEIDELIKKVEDKKQETLAKIQVIRGAK